MTLGWPDLTELVSGAPASPLVIFLSQTTVVVGIVPALWHLTPMRRLTPLAVFQIVAGIALGPSVLGRVSPMAVHLLFPEASLPALVHVSNFAVVLFGLGIGLHLDMSIFVKRGHGFARISSCSIVLPMLLGAVAGLWIAMLFPNAVGAGADKWLFAAGIGICIGVTALPVLAAILSEMQLLQSRLGKQALGCATAGDVALWGALAVLLTASGGQAGYATLWRLGLGGVAYATVLLFVVRPVLARAARPARPVELQLLLVCMTAFASAACTELLGMHLVLGALIAGTIIPESWRMTVLENVEIVTGVVLLPFFFAVTGLRTNIDFSAPVFTGVLVISTAAAVVGKVVGTAAPARIVGYGWRDALALGALMQAKGLMEVVALTVLLDAGFITLPTFSAMIVMAVITTGLSTPMARAALGWTNWSATRPAIEEQGLL